MDVRTGPAAAAVLAAGLGAAALGVLSLLAATSDAVAGALTLSERVGEMSGLTTAAAAVFFAAWAGLAAVWRRSDPSLARVAAVSALLLTVGLLGTFPPFVDALTD